MDQLSVDKLMQLTRVKPQLFEELPSTNSHLKTLAAKGAEEGTLLIARSQSGGRGRRGRSFHSPKDSGLYMSLLLRPQRDVSLQLLTAATAVALARAVRITTDLEPTIKWVNDLFYRERKFAGILTEGSFTQSLPDYLIVGMGINVYEPQGGFPKELDRAGALLAQKREGLLNLLVEEILNQWWPLYEHLDQKQFLDEYRQRSFLLGKEILVLEEKPWSARAVDIDEACNLVVEDDKGQRHHLYSGEVSVKFTAGD